VDCTSTENGEKGKAMRLRRGVAARVTGFIGPTHAALNNGKVIKVHVAVAVQVAANQRAAGGISRGPTVLPPPVVAPLYVPTGRTFLAEDAHHLAPVDLIHYG
jgi:hypothetical protein